MAEVKVNDNGPLKVSGATLLDGEGKPLSEKDTFYLCRCGQSSNKPFCDGTHNKVNFDSTVRA